MKKAIVVLIAILMLVWFSSCTVEEPCEDFVTEWDIEEYVNLGEIQLVYRACHYKMNGNYECIMISEEDYDRWTKESVFTTCWQDAEDSI